jgi:hypothetical protein
MFCHAVKSGQFHRNFYIERVADRLNINQQNFNLVRPTFGEWVARTLPTFSDKPLSVVPVPHARMLALGDGTIAGQDLRHAEFIDGADLLIHDAQYTAEEYPEKVGWGHSPVEYVVKLARYARVKRVALTHHDPLRDDDAIERMIAGVRQHSSPVDVFAAFEGQVVEVGACPGRIAPGCEELPAETPVETARAPRAVLLAVADTRASGAISVALRAESICTQSFSNINEGDHAYAKDQPSLAIVQHDPPRTDGIGLCHAIRRQATDEHGLAVVSRG